MESWRDYILRAFPPQVSRLTLAADPDSLLVEEGFQQALSMRGYELLTFDNPIAFRFAYESQYRLRWAAADSVCLIVRIPTEIDTLPYDLQHAARTYRCGLADIFPNFAYQVIATLDRADLDALYHAQQQQRPEKQGDIATRDFVLRHVFEIATERIRQPVDLLRMLLRRHYRNQRVPRLLDERIIYVLKHNENFSDWPLEAIISDRDSFFRFLQERWPFFVSRSLNQQRSIQELRAVYHVESRGPIELPLEHADIRVYIDTLFLEGMLHPILIDGVAAQEPYWLAVGIQNNLEFDRTRRLERLLPSVTDSIPTPESKYQDWLSFAFRWAELCALRAQMGTVSEAHKQQLFHLQAAVDTEFKAWVTQRYNGLHNQPPIPPVMPHHIPRMLARRIEESPQAKVAMVVLDGMALDQWVVIREILLRQIPEIVLHEEALFAWVPTITSVSRQALFAAKLPLFFPNSIFTTSKEPALWSQFWAEQGLNQAAVEYANIEGEATDLDSISAVIEHPKLRAFGLVITRIDDIMHGMRLGTEGMHNQVRQWAEQGFLASLVKRLFDANFDIVLTADHGNIEARGIGRPSEGAAADRRGERVRIYAEQTLRARTKARFPDAIEWNAGGLPNSFLPLLAPDRTAFVPSGERIVTHGGVRLEELVVPLIQVQQRAV